MPNTVEELIDYIRNEEMAQVAVVGLGKDNTLHVQWVADTALVALSLFSLGAASVQDTLLFADYEVTPNHMN